jgi:tetratricopeptide (TPR) repeat protein
MTHTHQKLQQKGISNRLMIFDGIHEWPPESTLEKGLLALYLKGVKDRVIDKNRHIIHNEYTTYKNKVKNAEISLNRYHTAQTAIFLFEEIKSIRPFQKALTRMNNSGVLNKQLRKLETFRKVERKYQRTYRQAFSSKDVKWWKHQIHQIQQQVHASSDSLKQVFYERIRQFISMMAFVHASSAIKTQNMQEAEKYLNIYSLADSANPDFYYLKAQYAMLQDGRDSAIKYLKKAVNQGFDDFYKIKKEIIFAGIAPDIPSVRKLLKK